MKTIVGIGVKLHILLLSALLIMDSRSPTNVHLDRLPSVAILDLLSENNSEGIKAAEVEAYVFLSSTCNACKRLAEEISSNYDRMEMKVTAIFTGKMTEAIEFIEMIRPAYEVRYTPSIEKWSGINIRRYPYIVITDKERTIVSLGAANYDLH